MASTQWSSFDGTDPSQSRLYESQTVTSQWRGSSAYVAELLRSQEKRGLDFNTPRRECNHALPSVSSDPQRTAESCWAHFRVICSVRHRQPTWRAPIWRLAADVSVIFERRSGDILLPAVYVLAGCCALSTSEILSQLRGEEAFNMPHALRSGGGGTDRPPYNGTASRDNPVAEATSVSRLVSRVPRT